MANPSPSDVEICRSRSSIASMYGGSTAPISTRTWPDCRAASKRSVACKPRRTASAVSTSVISLPFEVPSFLDRLDQSVECGIAQEEVEGHDDLVWSDLAGGGLEPSVAHDDVGIRRDASHRSVPDLDLRPGQALAELGHQQDAA